MPLKTLRPLIAAGLILLTVACGSSSAGGGDDAPARTGGIEPAPILSPGSTYSFDDVVGDRDDAPARTGGIEPAPILSPGSTYSVDDVVAAGWKKSRELSAETLPGATAVWYGFFNQKDIEVRVYPSHQSAIDDGTGPADDATLRGKPKPFAEGGITSTRTSYGSYAIVGNLVLLCETDLTACMGLIEKLN